MRSPDALFKFSFSDRGAPGVGLAPAYGECFDQRGHLAIVRVNIIHEVAEGGHAVWGGRLWGEFWGVVMKGCSSFSDIILPLGSMCEVYYNWVVDGCSKWWWC